MERAEKLKNHLADQDTNRKKPSAMGANGKASNGAGKGKYAHCIAPTLLPHALIAHLSQGR